MFRGWHQGSVLGGPLTAVLLMVAASPAAALVGEEEVRKKVAEEFEAEILRIENTSFQGRKVYEVTLMREGGDHNSAFKVDTILIDAETGEPLRGIAFGRNRSENLESMRTRMLDQRPEALRGRAWR